MSSTPKSRGSHAVAGASSSSSSVPSTPEWSASPAITDGQRTTMTNKTPEQHRRTVGTSSSSVDHQKSTATTTTAKQHLMMAALEHERPDEMNDDEQQLISSDTKGHRSSYKILLLEALIFLRRSVLLLGNVFFWYFTNGMNGIAMQSLSKSLAVNKKMGDKVGTTGGGAAATVVIIDTASMVATTLLVTSLQLLAGALIGCCLLWLHAKLVVNNSNQKSSSSSLSSEATAATSAFDLRHHLLSNIKTPFVSILHGMGSIFTNFGFMYGSAAVVQIIKLLEPFETLFFTKLFIPKEGKLLTMGIASSMILTTGAAMGLIRSRKTNAPLPAIVFAILSGLSLSARNVLQRKRQQDGSSSSSSSSSTNNNNNSKSAIANKAPSSTQPKSPLERSLLQFTQLSLQSGVFIHVLTLVLYCVLLLYKKTFYRRALTTALHQLNWRIFLWHPLYNAFSMITLGFCTAVTHSLLNAGKRVFAIVMAIVWFREGFTRPTAIGLFLVFCGGCWYTLETKGVFHGGRMTTTTSAVAMATNGIKPLVALGLISMSVWMHSMETVQDMVAAATKNE